MLMWSAGCSLSKLRCGGDGVTIKCDERLGYNACMVTKLLLINLGVVLAYMAAWFVVGYRKKQLNTVDVAWGSGFAIIAWLVTLQQPSARSLLIAVLVSIWAARITNHLGRRVFSSGEDPRYKELSSKWKGNFWRRASFSIFMLQGVLVVIISLPVTIAAGEQNANLGWLSAIGATLWLIGFVVESVGDRQLRRFVANKANRGKVMDQGLWRYSRHPNYFGEMVQWWAIGLIALQVSYGWIGLLGPLTLTYLLLFISGVPLIENRRKSDPAYRRYMERTSMIVPLPPKK